LVSLNAENCVSVQTPDLAGTIDVLFIENSGLTDTIQVLVDQSYIQMGDYSHKIYVPDSEIVEMQLRNRNIIVLSWAENEGSYENKIYSQPLIVDKTKFTMGDAWYYSKTNSDMNFSPYTLAQYPKNENLEESKLPLIQIYYSWRFANERSKREALDTAYIRVDPRSKDAKKFILLGDPSENYYSCESCTMLALDTSASGYRLPFEEEWFFLMRAGASTRYYWGDEDDSLTVSRYAWVRPIGLKPVAQLQSSKFGLYDMIGISKEQVSFFYKKGGYWDSRSSACTTSPECVLIVGIGGRGGGGVNPNNYEGFRLLRKTPKLHKLEKF